MIFAAGELCGIRDGSAVARCASYGEILDFETGSDTLERLIMWVYILRSLVVRDKFYVGLTDEPERRLREHNAGESFSTKDDKPWKILAKFWFESTDTAERFERYLKSGSGRVFAARHFA